MAAIDKLSGSLLAWKTVRENDDLPKSLSDKLASAGANRAPGHNRRG